jgi:methyl-accepting chemotaxis protein
VLEFWPQGFLAGKGKMGSEEFGALLGSLTKTAVLDIDTAISVHIDEAEKEKHKVQVKTISCERGLGSVQVVKKALPPMDEIEVPSDQIDDIAFQINLLVLNPGVEAARAGDAGEGFYVVGQDVRELAQRLAKAAQQIKQLIIKSGDQVKSGVALVDETGKALETMVGQIHEIDQHFPTVMETARDQSIGLQEINQSVSSIDQGTQQNATMVQELTAASQSLAGDLSSLIELPDQFSLGATGGKAVRGAAPVSVPAPTFGSPIQSPVNQMRIELPTAFATDGNDVVDRNHWEEF